MQLTSPFLAAILLSLACGCEDKRSADPASRARLAGTWSVTLIDPDGSSRSNGIFSVAADSRYQNEVFTLISNEVRQTTLQGIVAVEDHVLVKTITNIIVHWRPESSSTGHVTLREKMVRINEDEMVTETNEFGSVVYSKMSQ